MADIPYVVSNGSLMKPTVCLRYAYGMPVGDIVVFIRDHLLSRTGTLFCTRRVANPNEYFERCRSA